jgi:hypothetical protein
VLLHRDRQCEVGGPEPDPHDVMDRVLSVLVCGQGRPPPATRSRPRTARSSGPTFPAGTR